MDSQRVKPSEAAQERGGDIADQCAWLDQDYFRANPLEQWYIRPFFYGEDCWLNALNDPRGDPKWTLVERTDDPQKTIRWFYHDQPEGPGSGGVALYGLAQSEVPPQKTQEVH